MPLPGGSVLGHYQVLEFIGSGGMGEVYVGRDNRLGRRVAIKILKPEFSSRAELRQRFLREASVISNLSHPNICALFDVGNLDQMDYLVMEYLDGETLADLIFKGPFSIQKSVMYAAEIAGALHHAHELGILHRDLKPGNLIITRSGQLKLLDFGLASWKENTGNANNPTDLTISAPGVVLGTLPYMAPEQIEGEEASVCTDIFALGVILYEMINGKRPFAGSTQASLAASILSTEPQITSEMQKHPTLVRVIQRCLAKSPSDRWQNARDVMHELQWISENLQSNRRNAVRDTTEYPIRKGQMGKAIAISATVIGILILLFVLKGGGKWIASNQNSPTNGIKTLAVLPLNNLSADPSQGYLADAMTEELITSIAQVESLRVISRTSVMGYKGIHKPLPQIARELKADFILEGSILMIENQMRISAQLIDAKSDQHIWAQSYDRKLEDVFSLLNEVASSISGEIQIKMTPEKKALLANPISVRPEAYNAYLRGKYLIFPPDLSDGNPELAVQMLERAVQLDPKFALAYSALSYAYSANFYDKNPEHLKKAKAAVDRAFQLHPGMAEAHLALGYYYYAGYRDYDRALQEFSIAKKTLSGNTTLLASIAAVYRRTGEFERAETTLKEAFEYSPREARAAWDVGSVLSIRKQYAEADRYFDIAISLAPDQPSAYVNKATNYLLWTGDTEKARSTLLKMPHTDDNTATFIRFLVEMCSRNYESALKVLTNEQSPQERSGFNAFLTGYVQDRLGRTREARRSYEEARVLLQKSIKERSDSPRVHVTFGFVLAVLGEKDEAIREGKLAASLFPVSKDALFGPDFVEYLAFIYTLVGEFDLAVETLEYLLSIPSRNLSVAMLRIDPRWDPLRDHPRFKKLVAP